MEKIKEDIRSERASCDNYTVFGQGRVSAFNHCLSIINRELQDYTFIKVPKKVKLSVIVERLKTHYVKVEVRRFDDNIAIDCCLPEPHNTSILSFRVNYNTNQIPAINSERWSLTSNKKWLYELWIAGTIIEADI